MSSNNLWLTFIQYAKISKRKGKYLLLIIITMIKYYKTMFVNMLTLKQWVESQPEVEDTDKDWLTTDDLIKKALEDWVDKQELQDIIKSHENEKEKMTKKSKELIGEFINDIANQMLDEWIKITNENKDAIISMFNKANIDINEETCIACAIANESNSKAETWREFYIIKINWQINIQERDKENWIPDWDWIITLEELWDKYNNINFVEKITSTDAEEAKEKADFEAQVSKLIEKAKQNLQLLDIPKWFELLIIWEGDKSTLWVKTPNWKIIDTNKPYWLIAGLDDWDSQNNKLTSDLNLNIANKIEKIKELYVKAQEAINKLKVEKWYKVEVNWAMVKLTWKWHESSFTIEEEWNLHFITWEWWETMQDWVNRRIKWWEGEKNEKEAKQDSVETISSRVEEEGEEEEFKSVERKKVIDKSPVKPNDNEKLKYFFYKNYEINKAFEDRTDAYALSNLWLIFNDFPEALKKENIYQDDFKMRNTWREVNINLWEENSLVALRNPDWTFTITDEWELWNNILWEVTLNENELVEWIVVLKTVLSLYEKIKDKSEVLKKWVDSSYMDEVWDIFWNQENDKKKSEEMKKESEEIDKFLSNISKENNLNDLKELLVDLNSMVEWESNEIDKSKRFTWKSDITAYKLSKIRANPNSGEEIVIWKYINKDWEENDVFVENWKIELNRSSWWDYDIELGEISTIEDLENRVNELMERYKKEVEEKRKNSKKQYWTW